MDSLGTTSSEIANYYDEFSKKLVHDYVYGNRRIELAIERVLRAFNERVKRVLDIGCGIGYSSAEYAAHHPECQVVGVDISPANINSAKRLFGGPQVEFIVSDLRENPFSKPFDLIAMLDVYEHIPRVEWPRFNSTLSDLLTPCGTLVLTTPSTQHQNFLRQHHPEGLQIVDETVCLDDIQECARVIGAEIACYEQISVWHRFDYLHIVLCRDMERRPLAQSGTIRRWKKELAGIRRRFRQLRRKSYVRSRLGAGVSR